MKEIRGDAKNIRALLGGAKFAIDYYQREYRWETKQVAELIDDLAQKFLESHEAGNERSAVEGYGHYFVGSIIISDKDGHKFIIDGQQRLTTLTLLLIHIYRQLEDEEQKAQLADLIFSTKFGKRSFNLDVPERTACMEALFTGTTLEENGQPESVVNILHRYQDIEEHFPEELSNEALPYFADWLIENVHLVEITAYSDEDAYTVFETMNDRGLSLSPTEMLKGYLLANITDQVKRNAGQNRWKQLIQALNEVGKDGDADCLKTWLRSQYATKIRERKRGAHPEDFDRIATEFHRWVRECRDRLGLRESHGFFQFIETDFRFYARQYIRLMMASEQFEHRVEHVLYNADHGFTLQYMVLLAPLRPTDAEEVVTQKLRLVAKFLDILLTWRLWNFRSIGYSTMQYAMFLVMRDIRGLEPGPLAQKLRNALRSEDETFATNDRLYVHQQNRNYLHRLLARLTDYVEQESGMPSHYLEYVADTGRSRHEVEHVWADKPEEHEDEFSHPADFADYRNRIGGLLLLPKSFNASYGPLPYEEKLPHYYSQNLLARSLHPQCYEHNPGFLQFVQRSGLPFHPHIAFKKADLDERGELYRQIAQRIWNPDELLREVGA
jgi:hypothetical protein